MTGAAGMESKALVTFECECRDLGVACAAARMRLDERGPDLYRQAHAAYVGPKSFPAYFVRKWLSLRLSAVKRGMLVDSAVTPTFLERVTEGRCPVTLEQFSTRGRSVANPSVDRLVNEVTYLAGNICVLSLRANRAKGERTFEEVAQLAQADGPTAGLERVEWMRLASLMYGAWSRAYQREDPHLLPLAAVPGPGMFMSTSQVIQLLLTRHCGGATDIDVATARWVGLTRDARCPDSAFLDLRNKLASALTQEEYPGDAWLHGDVFDAFVEWYSASKSVVVPVVEELLCEHQTRAGDSVATLEWATSRYAS
jgi:hypothetical protein